MPVHISDVSISLFQLWRRMRLHACVPGRLDQNLRPPFPSALVQCLVDGRRIAAPVRTDGVEPAAGLLQQVRNAARVVRLATALFYRLELTAVAINSQMQLAPHTLLRRRPALNGMNAQPRAVDRNVERPFPCIAPGSTFPSALPQRESVV